MKKSPFKLPKFNRNTRQPVPAKSPKPYRAYDVRYTIFAVGNYAEYRRRTNDTAYGIRESIVIAKAPKDAEDLIAAHLMKSFPMEFENMVVAKQSIQSCRINPYVVFEQKDIIQACIVENKK